MPSAESSCPPWSSSIETQSVTLTPPPASPDTSVNNNSRIAGEDAVSTFAAGFNNNQSTAGIPGSSTFSSEVIITSGDGQVRAVQAVQDVTEGTPRQVMKKKKKTMNDEAVNYYNSMLKIQTALANQRKKVLKRKENVEILKQALLERSLQKEGVDIPEFENSDSSDSDVDDNDNIDL